MSAWLEIPVVVKTLALLTASNVFMTTAVRLNEGLNL